MNLDKAKSTLVKIDRVLSMLDADTAATSAIERDLLLSYVRELYDALLHEHKPLAPVVNTTPAPEVKAPVKKESPQPIVVIHEPVIETAPPPPPPPPAPKVEPVKEPVAPPVVERPVPPPVVERPVPPPPPAPKPVPPVVETPPPPPPPVETPKPKPVAPPVVHASQDDVEELFRFEQATDVAQKLSQSPIKDLKTAITINDRMLFVNELFNGDMVLFEKVLEQIQSYPSYDDARVYIESSFVHANQWTVKEKKKTAKNFAKLVWRRFLKFD
jgi:hypothetical protein